MSTSAPASESEEGSTTAKMARAAHSAVDTAAENLERAEKAFRDAKAAAGIRTTEATKRVETAAEDALSSATEYVRAHPLKSVGIAVAAGYLLSAVLKK